MAAGPAVTLKRLWRQNRWLTIGFALTLTLALVFIIRAGVFFVYWQQHRDEPIEGWMTVRYIAHSYRVDPKLVHDAIGLPQTGPDHRSLIRISNDQRQSLDAITARIIEAIRLDRAIRGIPDAGLSADRPPLPRAAAPADAEP